MLPYEMLVNQLMALLCLCCFIQHKRPGELYLKTIRVRRLHVVHSWVPEVVIVEVVQLTSSSSCKANVNDALKS